MASRSTVDCNSTNPLGDAVNASRLPPSILLGDQAYVVASRNETTARAKSRDDQTVEVTFWIADPPAVSFFSVHCSKPPISDSQDDDLEVEPHVVGAEGRFVLLRTRFASGDGEDEYFMYKGDTKSPSLECVPLPDDDRLVGVSEFGIVPRGDGGHYLLVALCRAYTSLDYQLHIYSSEDRTWRTEELLNPYPGVTVIPDKVNKVIPEKVITLREGVLGWIDFWQGMLVCNLLQKPLVARYIPLPDPLPENRQKLEVFHPVASPRHFRDLTCTNGVIKFIEMEHRVIITESREIAPEKPRDPSHKDVLYDSELIVPRKRKDVDNEPKKLRSMNGWRAVIWTREIESNCWLKGCTVDVDDILVDDSTYSSLLSGQSDESLGSLRFRDLYSAWPNLSIDGDNLLYLDSMLNSSDRNGTVVAVDLAKKTLKVEAPGVGAHSSGRYSPSQKMYRPCTLSNHLNMTPGIKVPKFCQITQVGSSANDQNNTAIRVGEPDSCESENKRPRLSTEKVNHAQNGAQSVVQNVHISQVRPDQNNQPPQLCFDRWDGTCYPGISSWTHQNNLQCFNSWDGPRDPGYAPWAPAPNLHGYGNYQPLWQQPPPSKQQPTPSSVFGPHEAPRPCFNNCYGASYHGYSQQLPARNSYAYGAPSDYGNYQQQWQQLPPIQELPSYAAWQQPLLVQHHLTRSGV